MSFNPDILGAHISANLPPEYKLMTPTKLEKVKEAFKNRPVKFKIEKVEVIKHREEKTGHN